MLAVTANVGHSAQSERLIQVQNCRIVLPTLGFQHLIPDAQMLLFFFFV